VTRLVWDYRTQLKLAECSTVWHRLRHANSLVAQHWAARLQWHLCVSATTDRDTLQYVWDLNHWYLYTQAHTTCAIHNLWVEQEPLSNLFKCEYKVYTAAKAISIALIIISVRIGEWSARTRSRHCLCVCVDRGSYRTHYPCPGNIYSCKMLSHSSLRYYRTAGTCAPVLRCNQLNVWMEWH